MESKYTEEPPLLRVGMVPAEHFPNHHTASTDLRLPPIVHRGAMCSPGKRHPRDVKDMCINEHVHLTTLAHHWRP